MHDHGKSDGRVVPVKLPNNARAAAAEVVEGRRPAKGNAASETRPGLSAGMSVSSDLDRVRRVARKDRDVRFTALLHHVTSSGWGLRIGRSARGLLRALTG